MTRNTLLTALCALPFVAACASTRTAHDELPQGQTVLTAQPMRSIAAVTPAEGGHRVSRRATVQTILPQNVRIVVAEDGKPVRAASGVVIGNGVTSEGATTYVLTNAHVVEPGDIKDPRFFVLVDMPTGEVQEFPADVAAKGQVPDADLAVLAVPTIALAPVQMADDAEVTMGDDVVVVAAPYGRALSVSGGILSQVDYEKGLPRKPAMLKTDAAIGYGASGGGVFSVETGKLLGIVEGYRTAKVNIPLPSDSFSFDVPMPGETFAASTAKIRKFLASKGLAKLLDRTPPKLQAAANEPL